MTLLLILSAWLGLVLLVTGLCGAASRGDAQAAAGLQAARAGEDAENAARTLAGEEAREPVGIAA